MSYICTWITVACIYIDVMYVQVEVARSMDEVDMSVHQPQETPLTQPVPTAPGTYIL